MNQNNNFSVLPFYDSLDDQLCRRSYAYGEVYPLYTPKGQILPFQFCTYASSGAVSLVKIVNYSTGAETDITSAIVSAGLTNLSISDNEVYVFRGGNVSGATATVGRYYLAITISGFGTVYSDVFTVVDDISPYLKIEWWDDKDLIMNGGGVIAYDISGSLFHHVVYLDTQLGMPEYEFEEEGETRDGLFFPEKMISEKTYRFSFLAPEYLLDAMRFIRMSDYIRVYDRHGVEYSVDTFLLTPKWQAPGMLAAVDGEFQTASVAKKIGNDYL